jgi:hypothetical protein
VEGVGPAVVSGLGRRDGEAARERPADRVDGEAAAGAEGFAVHLAVGADAVRRDPTFAAELLEQFHQRQHLLLRRRFLLQVAHQADRDRLEVDLLVLRVRAGNLVAPAVAHLDGAVGRARAVPDDEVVRESAQPGPVVAFEGRRAAAVGGAVVDHDGPERGIPGRLDARIRGHGLHRRAAGAEHVAGERGEADGDRQEEQVERFHRNSRLNAAMNLIGRREAGL